MAHRGQGHRFDNDWDPEFLRDHLKGWTKAVTVPVNQEVRAEHRVLSFSRVRELLLEADDIALMDCACRLERRNCGSPTRNCFSLNKRAVKALSSDGFRYRNPRRASVEEAMEVLRESYGAGLVHMAYAVDDQEINELCSCCSCCCIALSAVLRYGLFRHLLTAEAVEVTDASRCASCGLCVDRCQFGAREITPDGLKVNRSLCYGCGLCVESCPNDAIRLKTID